QRKEDQEEDRQTKNRALSDSVVTLGNVLQCLTSKPIHGSRRGLSFLTLTGRSSLWPIPPPVIQNTGSGDLISNRNRAPAAKRNPARAKDDRDDEVDSPSAEAHGNPPDRPVLEAI